MIFHPLPALISRARDIFCFKRELRSLLNALWPTKPVLFGHRSFDVYGEHAFLI